MSRYSRRKSGFSGCSHLLGCARWSGFVQKAWYLRDGETASQQAQGNSEFRRKLGQLGKPEWLRKTGVIGKTGMAAKNWGNWKNRNGCEKLGQLEKPEWLRKTGAIGKTGMAAENWANWENQNGWRKLER